jgi:hypothetical protein
MQGDPVRGLGIRLIGWLTAANPVARFHYTIYAAVALSQCRKIEFGFATSSVA